MGQTNNISRADAERFVAYFYDSIRYEVDFWVCQQLYKYAKAYDSQENKYSFMEYREHITVNPVMRDDADRELLDKVKVLADLLQSNLSFSEKNLQKDKETTKRLLKRFRDESSALPTFYQLINEKYRGNVSAYVDDLYNKSILLNAKRMKKFQSNPSHRKLRNDPGILYTISKLQYMALIHRAGYDDLLKDVNGDETGVKE